MNHIDVISEVASLTNSRVEQFVEKIQGCETQDELDP